ncbi:ribonucleoside-diphosphate reductase subunit alpha [Aneurinibacillus migulanus]|uniref:Ribonucleoside-diphosphate reductase n=1 Tax=Aneurinibacillus migulanus TaxID=47500 RepID=A0A0D1UXD1_ANEMI|nr:ribonucleoside-diphosphate reductase subunit alpha [Aneurinibacillus migulanus]KIV51724.1 ribonucleotide-diphosphate reductase subunit alpha [Aneurinibacillus migulanus]KON97840.1 ribonucleotide-diphosphate reductase subunit alpha [Aneurinibacillus migulanus]MED0891068.1 ribonucleoside-diphosphate reductase subunit alpha [Aneurinibacillus migulanus]MED1614244.1 ribonucleoside-diphosphate reductase subunit alpha [Aneurinibacillus migulanus]SDH95426.1 ribonucleoside-diphosphate reductase alph
MSIVIKSENRRMRLDEERLGRYMARLLDDFPHLRQEQWMAGVQAKVSKEEIQAEDITRALYTSAVELISKEEPDWTYVAARAYLTKLYKEAARNRGYKSYVEQPYGSFYRLVKQLTDQDIYKRELLDTYSKENLEELGDVIDFELDKKFTYIGLLTLTERYLTTDFSGRMFELPQERFMIIAMQLMINEPEEKRLALVKEAYWALSNQYMTVATPTLSNAGKARGGQLSSCFIDTVDDSLQGIYDSNTDIARLSKMGGGIGTYLGKIRARGSSIRGYENKSSGVIPWIRQLNNTAVSVDQLGTRKGSVAVYLDVWHKDILAFLDLKLNNGDERLRAHDVFPGVCIPDIFMEAVENREEFHLFDPHEVRQVMGYSLEDFYDEEPGQGSFRTKYGECVNHPSLSRITVPAIDIMKRMMISQLETGTPFMFYRDTVNRANPNKHQGMIYSSNLCTEILQNMSATTVKEEMLEDGEIVIRKTPGDFVVCNLSSINLGRAVPDGVLERLIPIQIRMLDNVIDINKIEVLQAQRTNKRYRAVGLGTFGLHHLLARKGIKWESEEAVAYNGSLYERINYLAIQASMELAKEKGAYPLFAGSEWESGVFFTQREYDTEEWKQLAADVAENGMRNGYLFAIAPTGSTSIIAGSTASIDPVYELISYEEKTTYKIANPAPDLSPQTIWHYKTAFHIDPHWSIQQAAVRQRHIDQGQSFNFYVRPDIHARDFLQLHISAWKNGLKTTYYVRSRAVEMDECESCM